MAGLLEFAARFGTEERCIEHLAGLRWPGGFVCAGCGGRQAWRLKARPRVYECTACHRQGSVTAGTVLHRTRTDLSKWFVAAYLMGRDKRGVSAKFLQRELAVAYQTAWTMAHKLRHGLSEDSTRPLRGFLEADETFIGGRGDPTSPGRSTANPDKSLVVAAVEKVPAPKNKHGKHGHAVKRQHGFFAGNARIAVLPAATGAELGAFLKDNVAAGSHLLTDGFAGYRGRPRRAVQAHPSGPGRSRQCRRLLPDHPYPVQQHQSLARRHPSRRQRQAPAALSAGMVLPVQSPQLA
jgi:transposase-like protein